MRIPTILIIMTLALNACSSPAVPNQTDSGIVPGAVPTADESGSVPVLVDEGIDVLSMDWDDRSIFKSNLIGSQHEDLKHLPDAPVYHINMQIDDDLVNISANQEVRFTNQEDIALEEVVFHLYPNILGGSLYFSKIQVGEMTISLAVQRADPILRIPLESPIQPGERATIKLDYTVTVPTEFDTNYGIFVFAENILALAHFYPTLAVYDENGWDDEIPPEQGDFTYADVSFFVVRVTAPADLVLAASGNAVDLGEVDGQQEVTFAAGPIRDFYLAASDSYETFSKTVGDVTINSYAPKDYRAGAIFAMDSVEKALLDFTEHYGPYPYTEFDIVSTATYAFGVEYPGITAIGLHIYDISDSKDGVPISVILESTIVHEFGHQYFYNLVGNDQLTEPWLDESLVQYVTWQYYKHQYGSGGEDGFAASLEERWNRVDREKIPVGMPVAAYEGKEYGAIVYGRGAFFFKELEKIMGTEGLTRLLQAYIKTYSWENASGDKFKKLAESHCFCDLTPLFEEWVY